jgi:ankyrin repeat protein
MFKKIIIPVFVLCVMGFAQAGVETRSKISARNAQVAATEQLIQAVLGQIKDPCTVATAALNAGADVHVDLDGMYSTSLHYACIVGNFPLVKVLCEVGEANIDAADADGVTPLMEALLAHGVDGIAPLTTASVKTRLALAQYLLDHGASLTVPDDLGWSAIMYLKKARDEWGFSQIVNAFLRKNKIKFTAKNLKPIEFKN